MTSLSLVKLFTSYYWCYDAVKLSPLHYVTLHIV